MPSAKSIMFKYFSTSFLYLLLIVFFTFNSFSIFAQDNSPYSRYGLGDLAPNSNIVNRAMGGISSGYADFLSINFNNPASFSAFQNILEPRTNKPVSGRAMFDVGLNYDSKTIRNPNQPQKFTSSNAQFSYVQLGMPISKNWGLSFGLRPISRISYKIVRNEKLFDPASGLPVDSTITEFNGDGGAYLPSIGTGVAIKNFSIGVNAGYLFGQRKNSTRRAFINDTVQYYNSNHTTNSSFGDLFFQLGAQYNIKITEQTNMRLGLTGNLQQNIKGTQDLIRETFIRDPGGNGDFRLDSVYEINNQSGDIVYPASYTAGFVVEHKKAKGGGWLLGADLVQTKWSNYRFFGASDAVADNWQLRVGGQLRPEPAINYFSNVAYRGGFSFGKDYITAGGDLPSWTATLGLGLPLPNYNRLSPNQFTIINIALEYQNRGNNDNRIKENTFRFSLGLNFSDLWFTKRRYD